MSEMILFLYLLQKKRKKEWEEGIDPRLQKPRPASKIKVTSLMSSGHQTGYLYTQEKYIFPSKFCQLKLFPLWRKSHSLFCLSQSHQLSTACRNQQVKAMMAWCHMAVRFVWMNGKKRDAYDNNHSGASVCFVFYLLKYPAVSENMPFHYETKEDLKIWNGTNSCCNTECGTHGNR